MYYTEKLGLQVPEQDDIYDIGYVAHNANVLEKTISDVEIEEAFNKVYGYTTDPTAMDSSEINDAINTVWNGETSEDETALSSSDVDDAINTEWNGESSGDEEAITAAEISNITK
jgi:hypothetical protein